MHSYWWHSLSSLFYSRSHGWGTSQASPSLIHGADEWLVLTEIKGTEDHVSVSATLLRTRAILSWTSLPICSPDPGAETKTYLAQGSPQWEEPARKKSRTSWILPSVRTKFITCFSHYTFSNQFVTTSQNYSNRQAERRTFQNCESFGIP